MSSLQLLSQLALVCPSCDHSNAAGSAKCISCGTALSDAAPAKTPAKPALGDAAPVGTDAFARPGQVRTPTAPPAQQRPAPATAAPSTTASAPTSPAPIQQRPPPPVGPIVTPVLQQRPPGVAADPRTAAQQRPTAIPLPDSRAPGAIPTPVSQQRPPTGAQPAPPNLKPSARPPTNPGQPNLPGVAAPQVAKPTQPAPVAQQQRPAPVHSFDSRPPAAAQEPIPASELLKKPAPKAPAPAASTNAARFALVVVGGSAQGQRFRLAGAGFVLGRSRGAILFPDDPFISAHHATFTVRDGRLYVRDESSASGIFVTIHGQEPLQPNTSFSVANRCFRYTGSVEPVPAQPGRPVVYGAPVPAAQAMFGVEELLVGGRPGRAILTASPLLTIGSSKCDLSYPSEEGLAPRHCELSPQPPGAMLRDLSGGLGTYVRIAPATDRVLTPGDRVRVGEQILQVEAIA